MERMDELLRESQSASAPGRGKLRHHRKNRDGVRWKNQVWEEEIWTGRRWNGPRRTRGCRGEDRNGHGCTATPSEGRHPLHQAHPADVGRVFEVRSRGGEEVSGASGSSQIRGGTREPKTKHLEAKGSWR